MSQRRSRSRDGRALIANLVSCMCEQLENRRLLCGLPHSTLPEAPTFDWAVERAAARGLKSQGGGTQIVWSNRGQASDNFASTFGTSAGTARAVVDAVLADWSRVITDWNRADNTTTLQVNISMTAGGFGGAGAPAATAPADGKPRTGSFTIGNGNDSADPNDSNGWYLDPNPSDHAEFSTTIINAFGGGGTSLGSDMYSVVSSELTHVLGLIADKNNSGGSFDDYLLESSGFVTNTGVADNAEGGGNGHFWIFEGPTIDHLMTSFNSGDPNAQSWGNIVHSAGVRGTTLAFDGQNWQGSQDVGNAIYASSQRTIPSFVMAHVLRDAYGYTIAEPAQFGTFYTLLNRSNGNLLVRGGAGTSADQVVVQLNGGQLQVSVNVGDDIPGTGAFSGTQNLPAFVSLFDPADVSSITIELGDGNDVVNVSDLPADIELVADVGEGNNIVNVGGNDFDSSIFADVLVEGGSGTDTLQISDSSDTTADTYTLTSTTFDKTGYNDVFQYSGFETITLNCSPLNNIININGLASATNNVNVNAGDGDDTINVGNGDFDTLFGGSVIVNGGVGTDQLFINDSTDTVNDTYTLVAGTFSKNSTTEDITFLTVEGVTLTANTGNNTININGVGGSTPVTVNGGDGGDLFNVGNSDIDNNLQANVTINGDGGVDAITFNDSGDGAGQDEVTFSSTNLVKNILVNRTINYATVENFTFNGSAQPDTITIASVLTGTTLVYNAGAGADDFSINTFASGAAVTLNGDAGNDSFVNSIQDLNNSFNGDLAINGGADTDSISLNDSGDATATAYTLTATTFQVSGGVLTNVLDYATIETFAWQTNNSSTTIHIESSAPGTAYTINAGNGNDTFNVAAPALNADNIDGAMTLNGEVGTDGLVYNDQNNAAAVAYTVTSSTVARTGAATLTYGTLESVQINAGTNADTFAVQTTLATTPLTLNGNNGNDVANIASLGDWDAQILGNVSFAGGANTDTLNILDTSDDAGADTYTVASNNSLKSSGGGTISYSTTETYQLDANNFNNTINVNSSFAGNFRVNGNGGVDTINLVSSAAGSFVMIDGGAALDVVNVNSDAAGTAVGHFDATQDLASLTIQSGGTQVMEANGSRVIDTDALTIAATGKLDLTNNDLIVDYVGASQVGVITALINLGRNGGLWNGNGITSSTAGANPQSNTTLGRLEGSEYDVIYGAAALFDGRSVDNTAILVKYTYYGDADFNGQVNFDDYARIDAGFTGNRTGWLNGDFDGNGSVNFDDYSLIDLAFNTQGAAL